MRIRNAKLTITTPIIYVILTIYAIVNVYPIIWMAINSFKSEQEFAVNQFGIPKKFVLENFMNAWEIANFGVLFKNSIFVSLAATFFTVLIGALASYFLARFEFKFSNVVYGFFAFGLLIPIHSTLVPIFILMKNLDLLNKPYTLLFPYIAFHLPITIFVLTSFMKAFPKSIEESAVIDGAGLFRRFWSIVLPMSRPALATVIILNFIYNWNEFAFALVLINDQNLQTLPLGLANFAGQFTTNYGAQMAGLTMSIIPIIVFYLLFEKNIVKGMTAGAVKE
ncbi:MULTISPECIES: carbohydrate ABC transporter permease [Geobacillus]|jgi:raffinose/stachyose/melibiose transport system permease protein|uniref:carbohydrate ABC transporter permease n=1 Tax=Geobacillus TaxID=129337 RepID=UPI00148D4B5B|nr:MULTISPECIES: carbohydrate ABC transporter permease [Geobacillus]MEC5188068.1 raffinose/stachyose/melibiose transport system permease protein [Geobacillus thermodenitrificans]MED0663291.1 carbohydrate ABC transporter permease [Geobacillus thermodenitrificans]NNU88638.1 carbohydrate ABC transporter permease [Geobacillus sp. MR]